MSIDTPGKIAVIGAGPIGLEAALYARYLGYEVDVYERGQTAENVSSWGHVQMFTPFSMNCSPLGLAALAAQSESWRPPASDALLTGAEWARQYLFPLAESDLLADSIHARTTVISIARDGLLKGELVGQEARGEPDLRLLLHDDEGFRYTTADAVIDASGTFGNNNFLGKGGIPAIGEHANRVQIEYGLPDLLGRECARYADQRVLVVGSGFSAATTVVALAALAESARDTRVTWITRSAVRGEPAGGKAIGPIPLIENDPLPMRRALAEAANELARGKHPAIKHWPGAVVEEIYWKADSKRFNVRLANAPEEKLKVDRIIANVGYRPDARIYSELQVHECYASGGPMKLAEALSGSAGASADGLDQRGQGPATLLNPEPDFYILGAKSYGRNSQFLYSVGLEQIRDLFTIIGDRADLNLYATVGGKGKG